ncbi:MAG: glycosyltransferase family 2 protein [Ferruginibacter sp.]
MNALQSPGNNNLPSVAVVILNWNGKDFLKKFLPSVMASTYGNLRIIVADNASTDDSVDFLKMYFPTTEIIVNEKNEGFANGYNVPLKKIEADYFVLLNSDVEVTPGWIEPVIELMEKDSSIAACQPKILDEKRRTHFEYAGACGGWIDALGYPFARGRVLEKTEADTGLYDDAVPCFWASGAAMFVKAPVFKALGGFDAHFFAHQEEIDLCWRMQLSGHRVFIQPASVVYHVGGGTLPKANNQKTFLNFRNNLIMIYKNSSAAELLYIIPARFFLDGLAAVKGLAWGNVGYCLAVLRAQLHFVKWMLFGRKQPVAVSRKNKKLQGVYKGSILWQYYMNRKNTFSEIVQSK